MTDDPFLRLVVTGYPDCTHYCLPGVPDVWTQLLLDLVVQSPFFAKAAAAKTLNRQMGDGWVVGGG